jgi:hypothetical protein
VIALAGLIGSAFGYYALLWMLGRDGDFLKIAKYLPQVMLPAELRQLSAAAPLAAPPTPNTNHTQSTGTNPAATPSEPSEVQAAFTTTTEPAPANTPDTGDRYGIETTTPPPTQEPAALDVQTAAPLAENAPSPPAPRPANVPSFTVDELTAAVQSAKVAQPSLAAGNLEDGPDVQRAKANSYLLLADLAQKATLARRRHSKRPTSCSESLFPTRTRRAKSAKSSPNGSPRRTANMAACFSPLP